MRRFFQLSRRKNLSQRCIQKPTLPAIRTWIVEVVSRPSRHVHFFRGAFETTMSSVTERAEQSVSESEAGSHTATSVATRAGVSTGGRFANGDTARITGGRFASRDTTRVTGGRFASRDTTRITGGDTTRFASRHATWSAIIRRSARSAGIVGAYPKKATRLTHATDGC